MVSNVQIVSELHLVHFGRKVWKEKGNENLSTSSSTFEHRVVVVV
jgi:hypothetical protein